MITIFMMFGISILSIILGFIALLSQKVYIDSSTNQPTELEIRWFGKLKTNFPAIVFVVIGFILATTTFNKCYPLEKVEWQISGSLEIPDDQNIDWTKGNITIFPIDHDIHITEQGRFVIKLKIEEGKTFEEIIQKIDYSHPDASIQIYPEIQYNQYIEGKETLIQNITRNTRVFKPVIPNFYNTEGEGHEKS